MTNYISANKNYNKYLQDKRKYKEYILKVWPISFIRNVANSGGGDIRLIIRKDKKLGFEKKLTLPSAETYLLCNEILDELKENV